MPDDCPVDDASRRALRELARRAEWHGHPGAAGAAQDASALRELGAEMRAVLARDSGLEQDRSWGRQSIDRLAAYSLKARADWTPEQIAELARLREDAVIALAPGPGESDIVPTPPPRRPGSKLPAGVSSLFASSRTRPVALVVVGCLVLAALILTLPHFLSSSGDNSASSSASTTVAATPTSSQPLLSTATSATATAAPPASPSAPTTSATAPTASASAPGTPATPTNAASTSHVTSIQVTADPLAGNPPEVILSGTINASGTDDVVVIITVDGATPSDAPPIDDSGQTSYNLTQTINLSPWCGHSSVAVKVSSGSLSQSLTVPVSGCSSN
jgi:hypothetical protein